MEEDDNAVAGPNNDSLTHDEKDHKWLSLHEPQWLSQYED